MEFEVKSRDSTSRIGELSIQDATITTPAILWASTPHFKPPDFSHFILTNKDVPSKKPTLYDSGSMFYPHPPKNSKKTVIPPSLIYPPSLPENIHKYAAHYNHEQSQKCCIVLNKALDDLPLDASIYILANSHKLILHPRNLINTLVTLREKIGEDKLIYTPGIGEPAHLAMLNYCTVDLTDSLPLIWKSLDNKFLTTDGDHDISPEIACSCPACNKSSSLSFDKLLLHNYYAAHNENKNIKNHIRGKTFRTLVESRATHPLLSPLLYLMDKEHYTFQEKRFSVTGGKLRASSIHLDRPDVKRFRSRISKRFTKPPSPQILLLLPCSARKPFSLSPSHNMFQKMVTSCGNPYIIHEVIVTSPLGLVPRELELIYPAGHYDIPITGYWTREEQAMLTEAFKSYLQKNHYETIISHLPPSIHEIYPTKAIHTCRGHPTSQESLQQLKDTLKETITDYPHVDYHTHVKETIYCILSYQFGKNTASTFLKDCIIKGKYPFHKIFYDDKQMGMLVKERGYISLTLQGAKKIGAREKYTVEIDDFKPHGSIFAKGIRDADASIRPGDEVIITHKGDIRAVGVSLMNAQEMIKSQRGEAIKIRHYK